MEKNKIELLANSYGFFKNDFLLKIDTVKIIGRITQFFKSCNNELFALTTDDVLCNLCDDTITNKISVCCKNYSDQLQISEIIDSPYTIPQDDYSDFALTVNFGTDIGYWTETSDPDYSCFFAITEFKNILKPHISNLF